MQSPPLHSLRAAVIGTGFIGPVHIEALLRLGVRVVAVCGSTRSAQAVADRFGIPDAIGNYDYRRLLSRSDIDVVHITSPNRLHYEQALATLAAGKHCLCEKPLAMNTRETRAIVAEAKKRRTVFAVAYNIRFYPAVLQMRHLVSTGALGDIIHVTGSYFQDWLLRDTDYNWRLLPDQAGRIRAVADIGTHWLDAACFILGQPIREVMADLQTHHRRRKRPLGEVKTFAAAGRTRYVTYPVSSDDAANVLLRFGGGAHGAMAVSQVAAGRKNSIRIEIYGSERSVSWDSEDPEKLCIGSRDEGTNIALRGSAGFGVGAQGFMDYPPGHVEAFPDTFKMLCRDVYQTIAARRRRGLFASVDDGQREVAVCEAILKSHRTRRWTRV